MIERVRRLCRSPEREAIERFNRWCHALALAWLLVVLPARSLSQPFRPADFPQYYMGGVMAWHGEWDSLYPTPIANATADSGAWTGSTMKPRYAARAEARGVGDTWRFVLPPPVALLFAPLALLDFKAAFWVFYALSLAACWGIALCASRIDAALASRPRRTSGLLALAVATSPLAMAAVRTGNASTFVALGCGSIVLALLGVAVRTGAVGGTVAFFLKFAPVVLIPVAVVQRRWRLVAWSVALSTLAVLATGAIGGPGIFVEFVRLLPSAGRSNASPQNQSVEGYLANVLDTLPLEPGVATTLAAARLLALAALLMLVFRNRSRDEPVVIVASSVALIAWLLVFAPRTWSHYYLYLAPCWGWFLHEARSPGSVMRRVTSAAVPILTWCPLGGSGRVDALPYSLRMHMMWAGVAALVLAGAALASGAPPPGESESPPPSPRDDAQHVPRVLGG